ncbi:hypothetical protein B9Z55_020245 [Caenorhabditis nigoni]|uniref:Uncharacterized protein n=1 Tax=Caenorhabditis nigoni TaxID=1611254 RepID=A0A2G5TLZ4_9PELO|nr:hypothetical protein B9Z55_020245 [Caenorhabditis nigoni]
MIITHLPATRLEHYYLSSIIGEVRRAAASFQEHPLEDEKMSETEIITIRKPDGTTETKTVVRCCVSPRVTCRCPREQKKTTDKEKEKSVR